MDWSTTLHDTKDKQNDLIAGRQAVMEAIRSGRSIECLLVARGAEGAAGKITAMAQEQQIPVRYVSRQELNRRVSGTHQGMIAVCAPHQYATVQEILNRAARRQEPPFVILCDALEDPHNVGAILRSAECAGAHGLILGKRRSAGLTQTVAKVSAGAIEYLPVARVTNMARTIDRLKQAGLWIAACDMDGVRYDKQDLTGPIGLVIGSEGKGISRLVREKCDFAVSIPMRGKIQSLNASNAAAVMMYEVRRQRDAGTI